ncbi:TatD family hydrolase [Anaerotardibacter muris]|uniref:TatD family hydrolase n=1 Tax=Anaerotardibacter muris TaxID=2941505 RepID=UPI00203D51E2|nr:TatD family hydrolase [Anaerotardibacter muris]
MSDVAYSFGESVPFDSLGEFERDMLFYQKRKKGKIRFANPPQLCGPVADTHAHLDMLSDPALALARSAYYGVSFICTIMDVQEDHRTTFEKLPLWFDRASEIYQHFDLGDFKEVAPTVRVGIGCHPHNAKHYDDALEERLLEVLKNPLVAAIGEVGLDYHYDHSPRPQQREAFRRQIRLSHETGLPLILHLREAHDEGFAILTEEGFPEAGVLLHCFNLDADVLRPWLDAGCYVAYGGPLTFKNTPEVREGALTVPTDRLLTETDSPFMTPEPLRGIECGPEYTIFTAAKLLEIFDRTTPEEQRILLEQVFSNALSLLDREATPWQRA